ncbi:MAG: hypothetical protein AB7S36_22730, partial [Planctomycetota bacterium]
IDGFAAAAASATASRNELADLSDEQAAALDAVIASATNEAAAAKAALDAMNEPPHDSPFDQAIAAVNATLGEARARVAATQVPDYDGDARSDLQLAVDGFGLAAEAASAALADLASDLTAEQAAALDALVGAAIAERSAAQAALDALDRPQPSEYDLALAAGTAAMERGRTLLDGVQSPDYAGDDPAADLDAAAQAFAEAAAQLERAKAAKPAAATDELDDQIALARSSGTLAAALRDELRDPGANDEAEALVAQGRVPFERGRDKFNATQRPDYDTSRLKADLLAAMSALREASSWFSKAVTRAPGYAPAQTALDEAAALMATVEQKLKDLDGE